MSRSVATGARVALLIVTDTYTDGTFSRLRAPRHDATALAEVLSDPEIGGYQVSVLENQASHAVRVRIERLFRESARDALILLYVSGHGIKDETGRLHLATTDTEHDLLASTSIPALWVRERIDHSPARKVVVWLDCCYGGAFPPGMVPKAEGTVDVLPQLSDESGRGCAVMTASTHIQFAFEPGEALTGQAQPSVFTNAIVEGLRTGDADRNTDGEIDANELYNYVYDRVKAVTPGQTPTRNLQLTGEIYIARSRRGLSLHPDLPAEIRQNLRSTRPGFRRTAVSELADLAQTGGPTQRAIASETLDQLRRGPEVDLARIAEWALSHADDSPRPPALPASGPRPPATSVAEPASIQLPHRRPVLPRRLARRLTVFLVSAGMAAMLFLLNWWIGDPAYLVTGWICVIVAFVSSLFLLVPGHRFLSDVSATLLRERFAPGAVTFRPDGGFLVCAGDAGFSSWDTGTWSLEELDIRPAVGVRSAAFSPDGAVLVIASMQAGIQLWNGHTFARIVDLGELEAELVEFSPGGLFLAAVAEDRIQVWNTRNWTVVRELSTAGRMVRSIAFSPGSRALAAGGSSLKMWSTGDWRAMREYDGTAEQARYVAFSPDGSTLATAGYTGAIVFRSTTTWKMVGKLGRPGRNTGPIAFSPDGTLFANCYWDGIRLWRTDDWSVARSLIGHQDHVTSLTFSPNGGVLASASLDGTLKLWRIKA